MALVMKLARVSGLLRQNRWGYNLEGLGQPRGLRQPAACKSTSASSRVTREQFVQESIADLEVVRRLVTRRLSGR